MTDDNQTDLPDGYMTMKELAAFIKVSIRTIQRLRKDKIFPADMFLSMGSPQLIRVDMARFKAWLADFNGDLRARANGVREVREVPPAAADQVKGDDGGPGMRVLS